MDEVPQEELQLPTAVEAAAARLAEAENTCKVVAEAEEEKVKVLGAELMLALRLENRELALEIEKQLTKAHRAAEIARTQQTDLPAQYRYY